MREACLIIDDYNTSDNSEHFADRIEFRPLFALKSGNSQIPLPDERRILPKAPCIGGSTRRKPGKLFISIGGMPYPEPRSPPMLYLSATLILLFTAWVFYGWIVAESLQIDWLKRLCAGVFILMTVLICLAGGVGLTRRMLLSDQRDTLQELVVQLHERLKDGHEKDVHAAIRFLAEPPSEGSGDILQRVSTVQTALRQAADSGTRLALGAETGVRNQ